MSILIKGMEMPKSCLACQLERHHYEFRCCSVTGGQTNHYRYERHPDCPLVPIPPHGDLIDIHALIDGIFCELESAYKQGDTEEYEYWVRVLEFARKTPTIIPADPEEEGE